MDFLIVSEKLNILANCAQSVKRLNLQFSEVRNQIELRLLQRLAFKCIY